MQVVLLNQQTSMLSLPFTYTQSQQGHHCLHTQNIEVDGGPTNILALLDICAFMFKSYFTHGFR